MTSIVIEDFGGIAPKINPKKLPQTVGQLSENTYLEHNDVRGLPGLDVSPFSAGASTWESMYLYRGTTMIGATDQREYAEAPVFNDKFFRIIETSREVGDYPRVYTLGTYYRLGIPAPATALTVTPTQIPTDPDGVDAESISYVYTYVDSFGNEGPPSPPTTSVDRVRDTDVLLSNIAIAPTGNYFFGAGAVKRIYRSNAGTDNTAFQFMGQVGIGDVGTTDVVPGSNLQEVLPSATWTGPPDDDTTLWNETMRGITNMPNGVLAGFTDKTLVFNEPYLLHAWPTDYAITFSDPIVAISSMAAGLLVVTNEQPFLVSGIHPASMAVQPLDIKQGCSSDLSMVDMGEYSIFASPDGLVGVFGVDAEVLTKDIFNRYQWENEYVPSTIRGFLWEGKYLGFYTQGGTNKGFVFDPRGGKNAFTTTTLWAEAGTYSPVTDKLYVKQNSTSTIHEWGEDTGNPLAYRWHSKEFITPKPVSFAAMRIETDGFDYSGRSVTILADGVVKDTIDISGFTKETPYTRLSAGYRAKVWEVRINGDEPVTYLGLFESMEEAV